MTGVWRGVIDGSVWTLWQSDSVLYYDVITKTEQSDTKIKTELDSATLFKDKTMNKKSIKGEILKNKACYKAKTASLSEICSFHKAEMLETEGMSHYPTDRKKIKTEPKGDNPVVQCISEPKKEKIIEKLRDYFRLDVNLSDLYEKWSSVDDNFKKVSQNFEGIRILRQDPVENLFSFICSSNNHISRISSMVEKLCENYGDFICEIDDQAYYSFPSVSSLAQEGVEENLRTLGFGYRAKYIYQSAKYIKENCTESWLYDLRHKPYKETKTELMKLCGVADCVCLMSMDKLEVVPVDTHVWQIAARDYIPHIKQTQTVSSLELWGDKAGWAHQVLFMADLKQFKGKTDNRQMKTQKKTPSQQKGKQQKERNENKNTQYWEIRVSMLNHLWRTVSDFSVSQYSKCFEIDDIVPKFMIIQNVLLYTNVMDIQGFSFRWLFYEKIHTKIREKYLLNYILLSAQGPM
ncbi:hypothetical protein KUTeg_022464 [Tegillarca granosa]|uniref:DNA-(apurinic or apyrimidinic site) lyase n=1 Tax=Tegillarca granosa TaxID=220873 RepID=A0ABQ9EBV9_TEGGR|nr:hypothetical protein KUTeg_022464 [Tegillarca granosa]